MKAITYVVRQAGNRRLPDLQFLKSPVNPVSPKLLAATVGNANATALRMYDLPGVTGTQVADVVLVGDSGSPAPAPGITPPGST